MNFVLKDEDTTWDDLALFTVKIADNSPVTVLPSGSTSSERIFFHPLHGVISVTTVDSCQAFFDALKTEKIVHLMPDSCNDPAVTEILIGEMDTVIYLWIESNNFQYVKISLKSVTMPIWSSSILLIIHLLKKRELYQETDQEDWAIAQNHL